MFKKTIIHGCDARGDGDKPYLTRYTIFEFKNWQMCLHIFHRSDSDEHHDHPWNFTSIILWRGYYEETPELRGNNDYSISRVIIKRVYPFNILRRKAEHRHRVVLVNEKPAVSLVFMGKYKRMWGFFTSEGWMDFRKYFIKNKC